MKPDAPINPQLLAVAPNLDFDTIFELYTFFRMVVVRIDVQLCEVLWRTPDYVNVFEEKLLDKRFGIHDSIYWQNNPAIVFYHVYADLVLKAMQNVRSRLSGLGILPICGIYVADFDTMNWKRFHDPSSQLPIPS